MPAASKSPAQKTVATTTPEKMSKSQTSRKPTQTDKTKESNKPTTFSVVDKITDKKNAKNVTENGKKGKPSKAIKKTKPKSALDLNPLLGITRPAVRRLARRAGAKRLSGKILETVRDITDATVNKIVSDAVQYMYAGMS